jgi:hypothetical protein
MERHAVNDDPTTLIHGYLDGELTDRQQRALGDWLEEDRRNVDRFVAECRLHSELCDTHGQVAHGGASGFPPLELGCLSAINGESDTVLPPSAPRPSLSSVPPVVLDLSPAFHSPLFTLHFPVGGFLFSYATASLILGVALLAGWSWTISRGQQIVHEVILQSPVKYAVESAKVEKEAKGEVGRGQRAEGSKSEIPAPAFDRGSRGERTANLTFSPTEKAPTTSLAPCPSAIRSLEGSVKKDRETRRQGGKEKGNGTASPPPLVSWSPCLPLFSVRTPTAAPDGYTRAFPLTPLAKARDAGAADAGMVADVAATVILSPQPRADQLSPQHQAELSITRGERSALPMNH